MVGLLKTKKIINRGLFKMFENEKNVKNSETNLHIGTKKVSVSSMVSMLEADGWNLEK